ncbi:MAG: hypothetical protein PCFJNLEI_02993 [Verrucomicrobiae bacterium]|nr:hypothetical protein [Verrucomicrobiae bacterium]
MKLTQKLQISAITCGLSLALCACSPEQKPIPTSADDNLAPSALDKHVPPMPANDPPPVVAPPATNQPAVPTAPLPAD